MGYSFRNIPRCAAFLNMRHEWYMTHPFFTVQTNKIKGYKVPVIQIASASKMSSAGNKHILVLGNDDLSKITKMQKNANTV